MFGADVLTFREFMMGEPLPLATLHNAVLEFLQGRDDGSSSARRRYNAYVQGPRMTQGHDLLSTTLKVLPRHCATTYGSGSTLRCVSDASAADAGCGSFRCGKGATDTWWTCDASRPYREQSASQVCW